MLRELGVAEEKIKNRRDSKGELWTLVHRQRQAKEPNPDAVVPTPAPQTKTVAVVVAVLKAADCAKSEFVAAVMAVLEERGQTASGSKLYASMDPLKYKVVNVETGLMHSGNLVGMFNVAKDLRLSELFTKRQPTDPFGQRLRLSGQGLDKLAQVSA
jgi:hypothetical protein